MPAHSASISGVFHGRNDCLAPATIEAIRRRSRRLLMPLNSIVPPMRRRSPKGVQPTWTSTSRIACCGHDARPDREAVALPGLHRDRDPDGGARAASSRRRPRARPSRLRGRRPRCAHGSAAGPALTSSNTSAPSVISTPSRRSTAARPAVNVSDLTCQCWRIRKPARTTGASAGSSSWSSSPTTMSSGRSYPMLAHRGQLAELRAGVVGALRRRTPSPACGARTRRRRPASPRPGRTRRARGARSPRSRARGRCSLQYVRNRRSHGASRCRSPGLK